MCLDRQDSVSRLSRSRTGGPEKSELTAIHPVYTIVRLSAASRMSGRICQTTAPPDFRLALFTPSGPGESQHPFQQRK
jgi:hypothetical protein